MNELFLLIFLLMFPQFLHASCYDVPNEDEEWTSPKINKNTESALYHWEIIEVDEGCVIAYSPLILAQGVTLVKGGIIYDVRKTPPRNLWRKVYYPVKWWGYIVYGSSYSVFHSSLIGYDVGTDTNTIIGIREDGMVVVKEIK